MRVNRKWFVGQIRPGIYNSDGASGTKQLSSWMTTDDIRETFYLSVILTKKCVWMQLKGISRWSAIQCTVTATCSTPGGIRVSLWNMHHTAAELTVRQRRLLVIPRNRKKLINVWSRCRPSFVIALLHAQLRRTRYCYSNHIRLSMGPSSVRLSRSGIVSKRLNESTSLLQTTL